MSDAVISARAQQKLEMEAASYKADLDHFFQFLRDNNLQLDLDAIRKYVAFLNTYRNDMGQPLSPLAIVCKKTHLKSFLQSATQSGLIEIEGTFERVLTCKPSKKSNPKPSEVLDTPEITSLINYVLSPEATDQARLQVLLPLECGLRLLEVTNLQAENVKLKNGFMIVNPKSWRLRLVPLSPTLISLFERYLDKLEPTDYILRASTGGKLPDVTLYRHLRRIGQSAGIKRTLSPKLLRDTCCVQLINSGINLVDVCKVLGYAKVSTVSRFLGNSSPQEAESPTPLIPQTDKEKDLE